LKSSPATLLVAARLRLSRAARKLLEISPATLLGHRPVGPDESWGYTALSRAARKLLLYCSTKQTVFPSSPSYATPTNLEVAYLYKLYFP
jgi:hypothetical protein